MGVTLFSRHVPESFADIPSSARRMLAAEASATDSETSVTAPAVALCSSRTADNCCASTAAASLPVPAVDAASLKIVRHSVRRASFFSTSSRKERTSPCCSCKRIPGSRWAQVTSVLDSPDRRVPSSKASSRWETEETAKSTLPTENLVTSAERNSVWRHSASSCSRSWCNSTLSSALVISAVTSGADFISFRLQRKSWQEASASLSR
mmetsp:Transcript_71053/g.141166  ORF Transcript_71053/g.141166 Transcript_71053/m.141166 type:complete len:208 (-) Transcript_71053:44-667(-)